MEKYEVIEVRDADNGDVLGYQCNGHIDKDLFAQLVATEFDIDIPIEKIKYSHVKSVPVNKYMQDFLGCGSIFHYSDKPKKYYKPVTCFGYDLGEM